MICRKLQHDMTRAARIMMIYRIDTYLPRVNIDQGLHRGWGHSKVWASERFGDLNYGLLMRPEHLGKNRINPG